MKNKLFLIAIIILTTTISLTAQSERLIPGGTPSDAATHEILIDDHPLGPNVEIISLEVKGNMKDIPVAEVKFLYHGGDSDFVLVNKKIEIFAGYQSQNESIFTGTTKQHEIKQKPGEPEIMTVEAEGNIPRSNDPTPVLSLQKGATIFAYEFRIKEDNKTTGEVLISGNNQVELGSNIEMMGFGGRFDGQYKVVIIKHIIKEGNWETKLGIKK